MARYRSVRFVFTVVVLTGFATALDAARKVEAKAGYETFSFQEDDAQKPNRKPVQPAADAPQPMTPQESASQIRLPKGFAIELVASEPLIKEPSCIAFDERGRLFVCELHGYNVEGHIDVTELNKTGVLDKQVRRIRWELQGGKIAEQAAQLQYGVVKMLTDVDGDGTMDKAEVWANELPPCYGVVAARGGIIIVCAPDIIFLADRDGDGKPEVRETLFTGFRTQVLERGVNNPRWGLDNWIYVGAGGSGGTICGPRLSKPIDLPHSDFRIKPDGSAIEPVNGRVGTFGLTINDVGDRFPSSGGQPAVYALPLPYHYLTRNPYVPTPETNYSAANYNRGFRISDPHPWRVKRETDPAWVKFYGTRETNSNYFSGGCSNEFYGDTLFPEEYRGNIFYCEPSLNMVHRCVVVRDGAGYKGQRAASERESEFLASADQWFRPMNLRVGPEGALYIVDMYREIIEDYSAIPRFLQQQYGLDKGGDHGRIWRLVPKSLRKRPIENMNRLDEDELVQVTGDLNAWRRLTAQRLLIERGATSVVEALSERLRKGTSLQASLHALYTLDGLGKLNAIDVVHALDHEDYGVRMHALRLVGPWLDTDAALLAKVLAMKDDPDPSVRLQLAMTLGDSKTDQALKTLLELARKYGTERWMAAAILSSSMDRADKLLLGFLQRPETGIKAQPLLGPLARTIAGRRNVAAMSQVLTIIAGLDEAIAKPCLEGLVNGISSGETPAPQSADGWSSVSRLLRSESQPIRDLAMNLAVKLPLADNKQLKIIFANAFKQALDHQGELDQRQRAIRILANAEYDQLATVATELMKTNRPPELQLAAIHALDASRDERVGGALLTNWPRLTPHIRKLILKSIFARANRLPALLDALENETVRIEEIDAIGREQLIRSRETSIATRAKKLFTSSTANAELQRRLDRYQKALLLPRNFERGRQLFVEHCVSCHKHDEQGHEVGPPLGTIVNKPDETLLLDLLDPSSRIEPEYRSYLIATEDGRMLHGVLVSESATSVTLRGEKGQIQSVLRQDIEIIKASNVSLMPSNLHQQISPQDAANLIAFLRKTFNKSGKN